MENYLEKFTRVTREEVGGLHPRLLLANFLQAFIPLNSGGRLRAKIMRLAGFQIGHGTTIWGSPTIIGRGDIRKNLSVGNDVILNVGCLIDLASTVTIDDTAAIGYEVMLITGAHTIGPTQRRAAELTPKPISTSVRGPGWVPVASFYRGSRLAKVWWWRPVRLSP